MKPQTQTARFRATAPKAEAQPAVQRLDAGQDLTVAPDVLEELVDLMADALLADYDAAQKNRTRVA